MIKQEANNTFAEGLMMDMNPLVTPNNVMTNCLNGTLITFNGNEYMLLNDMGNGRVETAYLPEGYIPMGTCELGGIIYIVSYNPLQGTCLIGSFPSPERNITSDERDSSLTVSLNSADFLWGGDITGAKVYYLKKDLDSSLQFYPGDKFIVYSSNIAANLHKLSGLASPKDETVRLSLGTVTSDGKLVVFNSETLKLFRVLGLDETEDEGLTYHIKEYNSNSSLSEDLVEYRNLEQQPYNIFSSKVSGTLVLVAELVRFTQFSANISHHFELFSIELIPSGWSSITKKVYAPKVHLEFSGDYDFIPYGILMNFTLINKSTNEKKKASWDYELNISDAKKSHLISDVDLLGESGILNNLPIDYFDSEERESYILNYEIIPCMIWGPVSHLAIKGSIALHKIGKGIIELNSWKYYNSETKCNLTWGLEVYEEEDKNVENVQMQLTRIVAVKEGEKATTETLTYNINKKSSYHGTFYELIPFNSKYYKLKDLTNKETYLKSNTLYLVKIIVTYGNSGNTEDRIFYRWLYTNSVFNSYFYDTLDYINLPLNMSEIDLKFSYEVSSEPTTKLLYNGYTRGEKGELTSIEAWKTLCAIKTHKLNTVSCTAKAVLRDDYKTFKLKTGSEALSAELEKEDDKVIASFEVESTIKYTDREDADMNEILKNEHLSTYSNVDLPADATSPDSPVKTDFISGSSTSAKYGNGLDVTTDSISPTYSTLEDLFTFNISYDTVAIAKAYATMQIKNCSSRGKVIPLAYNDETFRNYDLEYDGTSWLPVTLGTFGFKERGGTTGRCYVGYLDSSGLYDQSFVEANDVDFNWTGDSNIISKELAAGWNTALMFVAHHCTSKDSASQRFLNRRSVLDHRSSGFDKESNVLSWDSCRRTNDNVVFALIKSNVDEYYYPLNCAKKGECTHGYRSYIGTTWLDFYEHIATVLNNLFRYSDESTIKAYFLPNGIYYGDNYVYTVTIPIKASLYVDKTLVNLVIDSSSTIELNSDLLQKFMTDTDYQVLSDNLKKELSYNVTPKFTDMTKEYSQKITVVSKDTTSGIALRNHLLDLLIDDLGVIVCSYDGMDSGKSIGTTLDKKSIYCLNDEGFPELATKFNPIKLQYSGGGEDSLIVTKDPSGSLLYSDSRITNIYKNFVLDDNGIMLAKDPPKYELTVKREGANDTGTVYGYIKRGLSPDYEFWK